MKNTVVGEVQLVNELVAQGMNAQERIAERLQELAAKFTQPLSFDAKKVVAELSQLAGKIAADAASKNQELNSVRRGHKAPAGDRDQAANALRNGLSASRTALRNQFGVEQVGQVYPAGNTPIGPADLLRISAEVIANLPSKAATWTVKSNVVPVDVNAVVANLTQLRSKLEVAKSAAEQSHAVNTLAGTQSLEARVRLHQAYKGLNHLLTGLLELIGDELTADSLRTHHHEPKPDDEPSADAAAGAADQKADKPNEKDTLAKP